ncbi:hypothetical protein HPB48_003898 [Haemaphysalis longicornis]|uniref:RRM domain-containing protein n=1 Tax=Haemaphysalis longicornis TaxID=44386 RepID=A0A9J6FHQ4_HAELO|nr:hypothetical protein HPB48_003898 [Haemaphysalis longicornis]
MGPKKFGAPPLPPVRPSRQERPQTSGATPHQGLPYGMLPVLSAGKVCLHLRGLPDGAQHETITEFLGPYAHSVTYQGVYVVYTTEGRPSGEAIIHMISEESAFWAVVHAHNRCMMGQSPSRIEASLCTVEEMQAVLASAASNSMVPQPHGALNPDRPPLPTWQPAAAATPPPRMSSTLDPTSLPWSPPNLTVPPATSTLDEAAVTMLLVRNLPDSATEHHIIAFFDGFRGLKADGVYMLGAADPRFENSAFVTVTCDPTSVRAALDRQCNYICNQKVDLCIFDTDCALRWLRARSRAHLYNFPA